MGGIDLLHLVRQASAESGIRDSISNKPISVLGFYVAAISSFAVPVVREVGGSYQLASIWEVSRYSFQTSAGRLATAFSLIQLSVFVALLIRSVFVKSNKHLLLTLTAIGGFIVYNVIEVVGYHHDLSTALFGSVSTTLFLIPLFPLLGEDADLILVARKAAPVMALTGMTLSLVFAARFQLTCGIGSTVGWCPARDLFSYSICSLWAAVCLLDEKELSYSKRITLCCLMALIALLLSVRSWVIQASALAIYCSLFSSSESAGSKTRRVVMAFFVALAVVAVSSQIAPEVFETFSERIFDDTRSGQYETFFAQVNPTALIAGEGATAGYQYGNNANYLFFDNQFIYLSFHFGLIPVICLAWTLFRTIFVKRDAAGERNRDQLFCALLYVLALCGLSTFFSYEINVGIVLFFLALGYRFPVKTNKSSRIKMENANGWQ